jgi:hypothetical protein
VNTLDQGRADVEFIDRTRVFLAPNTLVVIYGTASQTQVSKTPPPAVEVEAGEVKAGLAALRGDAVDVAIKGGGRVSASSRDTVVQRKGDRTTVEVFDGKAGVSSGGKVVNVPEKFGTRFVGVAPPAPPRPLPPPPAWDPASVTSALAARGAKGVVTVSWTPAKDASAYRVELWRDGPTEPVLVSREEVPPTTTAFRGELAPGTYKLAVRTIDKEEYLGIAAEDVLLVLEASTLGGGVQGKTIDANPYGAIDLTPDAELEMSVDGGPFGPMVPRFDLLRFAPKEIRLRRRGTAAEAVVTVRYADVKATFPQPPGVEGGVLVIRAKLSNVDGIDVAERVKATARVHLADGVRTVALSAANGTLSGTLAIVAPPGTRIDIVDGRGVVLGSTEVQGEVAPSAPLVPRRYVPLGAWAPLWQPSSITDVVWLAPTAIDGAVVSTALVKGPGSWAAQGQVRGSGSVGPVGVDGALRTDTTDGTTSLAGAWLGVRGRVLRLADDPARALDGAVTPGFELAPALRLQIPVSSAGSPAELEPAVALGGGRDRFTWLVDVGGRGRLGSDTNDTGAPKGQAFLLGGGSFDALAWLRVHAALDAHLAFPQTGKLLFRGGLGLGAEAGTTFFGGVALRLSPAPDAGTGVFMGQLAVGYRAP